MTTRLRELAERWRMQSGSMASAAYEPCAAELLSILDAEGDGDGVAADNADVMVCKIGDYGKLDKRMWATVIYDDKKVAECYTNEDAELIGAALRAYSAHTNQARSGGVSDADVEDAARYRWLRDKQCYVESHDDGWNSSYCFYPIDRHDSSTYQGAVPFHHGTLDAAIDAARKGERHE